MSSHNKDEQNEEEYDEYDPFYDLIEAIDQGDTKTIKTLLSDGSITKNEINEKTDEGYTPLQTAAYNGSSEICELLLNAGALVNQKGDKNFTALHHACENGDFATVELLLKRGAEVNAQNIDGISPLYFAAEFGHASIIPLLAQHKANLDIATKDGDTALHVAAETGNYDVVVALAKNKADLNLVNKEEYTPLRIARENGHVTLLKYLIEKGAEDMDDNSFSLRSKLHVACIKRDFDLLKKILEPKKSLDKKKLAAILEAEDASGSTALLYACMSNNLQMIKYLVEEFNADVNAFNDEYWTPLRIAVRRMNLTLMQYFVSKGAVIDKYIVASAQECNNVNVMQALIDLGANASTKGFTQAFEKALEADNVDQVRVMADGGIPLKQYVENCKQAKCSEFFKQNVKKFEISSDSATEIYATSIQSLISQCAIAVSAENGVKLEYMSPLDNAFKPFEQFSRATQAKTVIKVIKQ